MKCYIILTLLLLCNFTYADTDGKICITEDHINLEAKDIFFNVSNKHKHTISFKNGNISYTNYKENSSNTCLKTMILPYTKPETLTLFKDSKYVISLVISWNSQTLKDKYGIVILHHFIARIVKNSISGEFVNSLLLGEGTKLETVD